MGLGCALCQHGALSLGVRQACFRVYAKWALAAEW